MMFRKGQTVIAKKSKLTYKIKEILAGGMLTFEGDPTKHQFPADEFKAMASVDDFPIGTKVKLIKLPTIDGYGSQHLNKIFTVIHSEQIGIHTEVRLDIPMKDWILYPEHLEREGND